MTAVQRKVDHAHRLRSESAAKDASSVNRPVFPPLSPVRRAIYLFIAGVAFALGMLGVLLPGLPTTPFLLVTSALLLRAWPAMHKRMLRSRFIGGMLSDWRAHRGVRPHVKVRAITLVVAAVTATIIFGGLSALAAAAAGGCAGIGVLVIVLLPTVRN